MLNARLYRTAWLVAGVAIIVALLTLQSRPAPPEPGVPFAMDGGVVREAAAEFDQVAPFRIPGSQDDQDGADWVAQRLEGIPFSGPAPEGGRVRRQEFVARDGGVLVRLTNVYLAVPGPAGTGDRAGIVVVAPRDETPGGHWGAGATALLVEMARLSATTAHQRPVLFVSTTASTAGNAGMRWFLSRFSDFRIAAMIVLDAPADGDRLWLWGTGDDGRQSLDLEHIARTALGRAGITAEPHPGFWAQLGQMAVPQTFGEQGPAIAAGIPALTVAARPDGPPRRAGIPEADRLTTVGNGLMAVLGTLDQVDRVDRPARGLILADRELSAAMLRVVLLLLLLPVLVAAVDAMARLRRAGVKLRPGLRALLWRAAPLAVALGAMHLLGLAGFLPRSAAGALPLPTAAPFSARGGLVLGVGLLVGVGVWWFLSRPRGRAVGAAPAAQAAAGLVALAAVCLACWALRPSVLLLALPAAHAVLVATAVPRRWQVGGLMLVAVLPVLAVLGSVAVHLHRDVLFAGWYLAATTAEGARGLTGPVLGIAVLACVWSMAALVALRARKGLVAARPPLRRRRPPQAGARRP